MLRRIFGYGRDEENYMFKNVIILHQILLGDQINEDEMFQKYSTHGRGEEYIQRSGRKPEGEISL
jgi:hypothetical protein